ncbi:hypothetical protein GCM10027073_27340 [Streptomyces chlorus]
MRARNSRPAPARHTPPPRLSPAELVRDAALEAEVRRAVARRAEVRRAEVRRAEAAANTLVSQADSIRTFRILAQPFTEEHGLLTPSLKLKRRTIEKAYQKAYEEEVETLCRT